MGRLISVGLVIAILVWASNSAAEVPVNRRKPHPHPTGSCPQCSGPQFAPPPGQFNFYFLVRQWGPEFCHKGCTIQPDPDQFTLHGLWPNLDNPCPDDFPEHCQDSPFDINGLPVKTYDRMLVDWPSLKKTNECFWEHEWDCHGSCSGLDQAAYFKTVLDLHEQYDIKAALDAASIYPSNTPIRTDDVISAIAQGFGGVEPILHCSKGGSRTYLNEVFLPVDKNFKVVSSSTVCRVHPCVPSDTVSQQNFCGDELIYKVPYTVTTIPQQPCTGNLCKPKSGKCS